MLPLYEPCFSLKFVSCYYEDFQQNDSIVKEYIKDIEFESIQIDPIGGLIANRVLFSYLNVVESAINGIRI